MTEDLPINPQPDAQSRAELLESSGTAELSDESDGAYKIDLPSFHGPLDLLLHLIKRDKVDIYDIPISSIIDQYNAYLDAMEELDLEVAADYIYMAALLINIKSRMLLPKNDETIDDPRIELVDRLLEYQRFKAVAESFAETDVVRMGVWARPPAKPLEPDAVEIDMSDVSLFDLIDAFRGALRKYRHAHPQSIELTRSVHKVSDKMKELVSKLETTSPVRLLWYLEGRDRPELVAIFLAVLELVRLGAIGLTQIASFGEIVVKRTDKEIDHEQFALYDN